MIIARSELEAWWQDPEHSVKTQLLDALDGAQTSSTNFCPTATRSADGKLWFANQNVVQEIDPARLYHNGVPPPVHIEQVIADHKAYSTAAELRLPALTTTSKSTTPR